MQLVYRNKVKIQKILKIFLGNLLESRFSEKDVGSLAESKLKRGWQCPFAVES